MSEAQDRRVLRAYAQASAVLDETPAAQTRSAILAAAARAAGSGPQPLDRPRRWRLPLAAAASLLVGTLAVLLATHVDRQSPGEGEVAAPSAKVVPSRPAPAPAAEAPPAPTAAAATDERAAASATGRAPSSSSPSAARRDQSRPTAKAAVPAASAEPAAAAAILADEARERSQAPVPAAPKAEAERAAPAAAPVDLGRTQAGARALAAKPSLGAGDSRVAADVAPAATPWRADVDRWIEHIVRLRADGRDDDADAELALLRQLHPKLRIPASALRAESQR